MSSKYSKNKAKKSIWVLLLTLIPFIYSQNPRPKSIQVLTENNTKIRLAFGSCFKNYIKNPDYSIFNKIASKQPDVFLWMGDVVYLGNSFHHLPFTYRAFSKQKAVDLYNELKFHQNYTALDSATKIIGVWDDHDSGACDSDASNPEKEWYREKFLDFLDEDDKSPRRFQKGGMYTSYYLDPVGRFKLILMDLHFDRTEDDYLGEEQRRWLVDQIGDGRPETFIIVSTIPLIADDRIKGDRVGKSTRRFIFELINRRKSHCKVNFSYTCQIMWKESTRGISLKTINFIISLVNL